MLDGLPLKTLVVYLSSLLLILFTKFYLCTHECMHVCVRAYACVSVHIQVAVHIGQKKVMIPWS